MLLCFLFTKGTILHIFWHFRDLEALEHLGIHYDMKNDRFVISVEFFWPRSVFEHFETDFVFCIFTNTFWEMYFYKYILGNTFCNISRILLTSVSIWTFQNWLCILEELENEDTHERQKLLFYEDREWKHCDVHWKIILRCRMTFA